MAVSAREDVAELLGGVEARGGFSARATLPVDDLSIEVRDVGVLRFPVLQAQARRLCAVARPARYGRGEETLLDRRVRDTWEVPRSRVTIDKRRWHRALAAALDRLRGGLGLPDGCALKAELHSMLVYGPGQFFVPHQDSEKDDAMVGSLVVTLPSSFTGGDLVVEHGREAKTYRSSRNALTLVAFYADCRHQITPVKSGYRITLTYNLLLRGEATSATETRADTTTVDAITAGIEEHFATPADRRYGITPAEPPTRLVYLLDHEYTRRGLSWSRLKGSDALRAAALRDAAQRADCDIVLALADVHETWSCYEDDESDGYRRWDGDAYDDDDDDEDDRAGDGPSRLDDYQVDDLMDREVTLDSWTGPEDEPAQPVASFVGDDEVCASTPSSDLRPYASEYEGYMGNYGNTLDRWYHRGALVLWPRELGFMVRAEASPEWALDELAKLLQAGDRLTAQERAETLEPIWHRIAGHGPRPDFAHKALLVAWALEDPSPAATLVAPLRLHMLEPGHAPVLTGLVETYGEDWVRGLVNGWSLAGGIGEGGRDHLSWVATLARLSRALVAAGPGGPPVARQLAGISWRTVRDAVKSRRDVTPPSHRALLLDELAEPVLGLLQSAAVIGDTDLRDDVVGFLCADADADGAGDVLSCLLTMLRAAAALEPARRSGAGFEQVATHCRARLESRLAQPQRAAGDWSIELPEGCACKLCQTLAEFLADRSRQAFEWRIAKEKRRHVHSRIDSTELPVRHETRRQGSPHTLVLTKTKDPFAREEQAHRQDQDDLTWLATAGFTS